jgi:hypothetical protein
MLLPLPAVALAQTQVTRHEPGEPLDTGAEFQFQAQVTGPGAGGGCHWAVTDPGRRLESWDGVSLVEREGGRHRGGRHPQPPDLPAHPGSRGDHRGAGIRARIALHTLDQAMAPPR